MEISMGDSKQNGKEMLEVRWHGRGGQGAKTAAMLFAETAIDEGKHGQGFPDYGPERMGAPMRGFTRISDNPILVHSGIEEPQIVVVLDQTLLDSIDITEGVPEDGIIIVNTHLKPNEIREKLKLKGKKVYTLNATQIALDTIGRPIPNTVMLGALIKLTKLFDIDIMEKNITKKFTKKYGEKVAVGNVKAIKRAFEEVVSE
jgi:pyruvate ferredoxin oxidoreductase gamma subunit